MFHLNRNKRFQNSLILFLKKKAKKNNITEISINNYTNKYTNGYTNGYISILMDDIDK